MAVTQSTTDAEDSVSLRDEIQYPNSELETGDSNSVQKSEFISEARERVRSADMVVLTDGDADGVSSGALVDMVFESFEVAMIPIGPHAKAMYPSEGIDVVLQEGREDMTVFFLDTCLNDEPDWVLSKFERLCGKTAVHFFDHHEWSDSSTISTVQDHAQYAEIDSFCETEWTLAGETMTERCTVNMVYDYFSKNGVDFTPMMEDRVKAVAAGDLWLKDDDGNFKHNLTQRIFDSIEYVTDIDMSDRYTQKWFGYNEWVEHFTDDCVPLMDTKIATYADTYRTRMDKRVATLFEAEKFISYYEVEDITVTFVYGDVPPNEAADELRQDSDLVFVLYPWGRCSLRGTEQFDACHHIAEDLGGGGHQMAAGAPLKQSEIGPQYEDQSDYYEDYGAKYHQPLLEYVTEYL